MRSGKEIENMKKRFLFFLFVGLWAVIVNGHNDSLPALDKLADRLQRFGERIPQEKVFVHIDNTCYYLGDTIWFAAYTRQTNTDRPSKISRVLYAELWNHDGYLVERKLIEMKNGRGSGFFELYDTLYSGYFELRAYTRWQLNWGQTEHEHPKVNEYGFYNKVMAKEFYRDYEKLYSRVFPVYDKPKEQGTYYKDMTYRPLRRYFKDAPPEPELRLSLFPEGGNLVAGVPCRVAFEAATSEGEVREGTVSLLMKNEEIRMKNEQGEEVTSVRTENRGRGTFTFTPVEGQSYEVVFHADGDSTKRARVTEKIKAVTGDGVSLRLRHTGEEWTANIQAMGSAAEHPLGMTVMHEGRLQCFTALTPDARQVVLADSTLSAGINQLTVFDAEGRVYADRLFFVTKPEETKARISVSGMKDEYTPFEQVNLQVTAPSLIGRLGSSEKPLNVASAPQRGANSSFATEGKAGGVSSHLSLSVRDAVHQDNIFDSGNILTEMLLSSEIKGFVPQPEYFFEADDAEHRRTLDLLMLTQGWRRFNWHEMATPGAFELTQPAESMTQVLRGDIYEYDSSERTDQGLLTLILPGVFQLTESTANTANLGSLRKTEEEVEGEYVIYQEPNPFGEQMAYFGPDLQVFPSQLQRLHSNVPDSKLRTKLMPYIYDAMVSIGREEDMAVMDACSKAAELNYPSGSYRMTSTIARARYSERRGLATKNVWLHTEFAQDGSDVVQGDMEVTNGHFQIPTPHFYEWCVLFLVASDSSKWRNGAPPAWVEMNEMLQPEFYVRIAWPYPRFTNPYSHYQCNLAPLRKDSVALRLQTGFSLDRDLNEVTIRARRSGLRRYDASAPVLRVDAYHAFNEAVDAGLSTTYYGGTVQMFSNIARLYVGDMGTHTPYLLEPRYDRRNTSNFLTAKALNAYNFLYNLDSVFVYTDYAPRNPDTRVTEDNVGRVTVDLRRLPNEGRRVTYRDRRLMLQGFSTADDFYHPDYHRNPPKEGQKDYRRTLYWNPDVQLDAEGKANITFFNNSQTTRLCIEANGQAADGTLLYNKK